MAAPISLAGVPDLADWLGETIVSDDKRAGWALRAASALVRQETGKSWLDDDGTLVDPLPDDVAVVTLACAARGYVNPRGVTDASEAVDDYNHREQVRVDEAGFFLTESEKQILGALTGATSSIGTISTERGDLCPVPCDDEDEWLLPPYYR